MRHDSRLPRVLHALLHLAQMERPATSDELAAMLATNSVVVRRTMAGLREAGFVTSSRGHGGGWVLARPLDEISLLALYRALGEPSLFAIGIDQEDSACQLAQAANHATQAALRQAQAAFEAALEGVSVADVVRGHQGLPSPCPPGTA